MLHWGFALSLSVSLCFPEECAVELSCDSVVVWNGMAAPAKCGNECVGRWKIRACAYSPLFWRPCEKSVSNWFSIN